MKRPDPGLPFRRDAHWEVLPDGEHWRVLFGDEELPCHQTMSRGRGGWRCGRRAAAATGAFGWCADHMDGRWIENGRVVAWCMVDDPIRFRDFDYSA